MAKKKGLLNAFVPVVSFIFDSAFRIIRWLASLGWKALKFLGSFFKKKAVQAKERYEEGKRPSQPPVYEELRELEKTDGDLFDFENQLYQSKSTIGLILGSRGSGKSALGMKLLENVKFKSGRATCAMGFKTDSLPAWVKPVSSLEEVPNGAFVLVDEGGIVFSSRSSMSSPNKLLSELLFISRHKDISVLFITQNSANIEVNTIRQVDYLVLKSPSLLQLDFERKKIKDIYEEAKKGFEKFNDEKKSLTFIYSSGYKGFVANVLPSFWSTELSKSYSKSS